MANGLFLGRAVDPATGKTGAERFLLDPADLTTHGLIVGMTGSGKTALGIVLIEELLLQGVPVLAIDPKGDLGNLLLQMPSLSTEEFAPWVDTTTGASAESEAKRWSDGLAGWGLGAADVTRLAASREAALYTPGSRSGRPLDLLGSCAAPAGADDEDAADVASAFVSGLLGLCDIEANPARSREHILLSLCVRALWEKGEVATIESLIGIAAQPPFPAVGALPLETFYPAKERQELVFALNNLLASPTIASFRAGEPLDVDAWLSPRPGGKARLTIVTIAHLSDAERSFVVATVLSRAKAWMRRQPGRSTLGALLYIDEIFGFFPPSAEPPTKKPLLTLLKQARAFGFGVVVATQNPVDLDYKGLANCGCWWVGTLQAERDRKRLVEGLTDAAGLTDVDKLLDATRKRVFLVHDVHRKGPALVETRWAMSYLRGPMTKEELARLPHPGAAAGTPRGSAGATTAEPAAAPVASGPPPAPAAWPVRWVARRGADIAMPHLFVRYAVRYKLDKASAGEAQGVRLFPLDAETAGEVVEREAFEIVASDLAQEPPKTLRYEGLPQWLGPRSVAAVEKAVKERLPDKLAARLLRDPVSGALGKPGESRESFADRLEKEVRMPAGLLERLEKKRLDLARAESDEKGREMEKYASVAGAAVDILGGLFGKRKSLRVGKVGSVLSKNRMEGAAESRVTALRAEVAALEAKLAPADPDRFEDVEVVPARAHVDILSIGLAWVT